MERAVLRDLFHTEDYLGLSERIEDYADGESECVCCVGFKSGVRFLGNSMQQDQRCKLHFITTALHIT